MLTDDEKALYFTVARGYAGLGGVIELGPWLGSGTFQICEGLQASGRPWSLTVVDRFAWTTAYAGRYPQVQLAAGQSFLPLLLRNLGRHTAHVIPVQGDIGEIATVLPLGPGDRLELVFIDAPRSWRALRALLKHLGPQLLPGARLVVREYLHVASRQMVWLLASIPHLRLAQLVGKGAAASFVASGPFEVDNHVPREMTQLSAADLMGLWTRARAEIPEARMAELAFGMALDLLERGAGDQARTVLDETVVGKPALSRVVRDVDRLIGKDEKAQDNLAVISAYLKGGIGPAETLAERTRRSRAAAREARRPTPVDAMEPGQVSEAVDALRAPLSATALAIRYQLANPEVSRERARALHSAFDAIEATGAARWVLDAAVPLGGRDIVELGPMVTLRGLAMRALGASSYVGVLPTYSPERRSFAHEGGGEAVRCRLTLGAICELDGAIRFVPDPEALNPGSADLAFVQWPAKASELPPLLAGARRLLRPGGLLRVWWRGDGQTAAPNEGASRRKFASVALPEFESMLRDTGFEVTRRVRELKSPYEIAKVGFTDKLQKSPQEAERALTRSIQFVAQARA